MLIRGTAQPGPPPALNQTAAPGEEQEVLLILLGASLWEEARSITPHIACGLSWILCSQLFVEAALLLPTTLPTITTAVASLP